MKILFLRNSHFLCFSFPPKKARMDSFTVSIYGGWGLPKVAAEQEAKNDALPAAASRRRAGGSHEGARGARRGAGRSSEGSKWTKWTLAAEQRRREDFPKRVTCKRTTG